jgi:hypothetical protein
VGTVWGVPAFVQVKPTVFVGEDRPSDWSLEVVCKVVGF